MPASQRAMTQMLRRLAFVLLGRRQDFHRAARLLDRRDGGFRSAVNLDGQLGLEFTAAEQPHAILRTPDNAGFHQRFGSRRCSGIWPPSKPLMRTPERAVWPLPPRPAVLPLPEPMPRPTRMRFLREPALSAISLSFIVRVLYLWSMIATENRFPLFGIMLRSYFSSTMRTRC